MRSQIILIISSALLIMQCDQTPTTLDEIPYLEDTKTVDFSLDITAFEFDFLAQEFYFSVKALSPDSIMIEADLRVDGMTVESFSLNDLGNGDDIQVADHVYDQNWVLPDSLQNMMDSLWTLSVGAVSAANTLSSTQTVQPERPAPPIIASAVHLDTLILQNDNLVLDTLIVTVNHPKGLDEIRSVTMMSLKPDGEFANNGLPIPLYDDGGSVVFFTFEGIDFTSGDQVAGDGQYSLLLALSPINLSGTYYWTFNAQSWLGIEADPVQDSLIVLPPPGLLKAGPEVTVGMGVFQ